MKTGTIEINGKSYPYAFNMKARRMFMQQFGLETFQEYSDKLNSLSEIGKGLGLGHIDVVGYLLITAIESKTDKDCGLDPDVIWDYFEENEGSLQKFITEFTGEQEQPEKESVKKSNPSSSGGKSKKGK